MRLTVKLSLALFPGILLVLVASSYLEMRRDIGAFNIDSRRDNVLIGRFFTATMSRVWALAGRDQAISLVGDVQSVKSHQHQLRWLEAEPTTTGLSQGALKSLAEGNEVFYERPSSSTGMLFVYSPLLRDGKLAGVLEVSEPLANERHHAERIGLSMLFTTASLAAVSLVLTTLLGIWFVGRPIRALIHQAHRVGSGDFSGQLLLPHADEIGELATEMNWMTERLADANQQLKSAHAARIAALEQLRHADRLSTVGKLASGVAHELGTPLNVVSGRAQLIVESLDGDAVATKGAGTEIECVGHAQIIIEQTRRMSSIIRQLLDFARQHGTHKDRCDLHRLASQTVTMLATLAEKHKVVIVLSPTNSQIFVAVDASQIQQVLTNVLVNSIQSMPTGGTITLSIADSTAVPPPEIDETATQRVAISICDEGSGISDDVLPHIFEPFFTTKPVGEATGLGLSVAYGIVRDHNGFITVNSNRNRGTCFAIHLPVS